MQKICFFVVLFLFPFSLLAQQKTKIILQDSRRGTTDGIQNISYLRDPVFRHENGVLSCDSAVYYESRNVFEAFNNVHIVQGDTINIYSDHLTYDGNTKIAHLTERVRMIDKENVLTTNILDYNMGTKVGTYVNGGKIVNKDVTLTSKNGYYFSNSRDAYFRYNVVVVTPQSTIKSDTLRYNTLSNWAYFYGPTNIKGKGDNLYTENGAYNTKTEYAYFGKKNLYTNGTKSLKGDSLYYDGIAGYGKAVRNIVFKDTADKTIMYGQLGYYYKKSERAVVTKNAYIGRGTADSIKVNNKLQPDSLWMGADTLETQMVLQRTLKLIESPVLKQNNELGEEEKPEKMTSEVPKDIKAGLAARTQKSAGGLPGSKKVPKDKNRKIAVPPVKDDPTKITLPKDSLVKDSLVKDSLVKNSSKDSLVKAPVENKIATKDSIAALKDTVTAKRSNISVKKTKTVVTKAEVSAKSTSTPPSRKPAPVITKPDSIPKRPDSTIVKTDSLTGKTDSLSKKTDSLSKKTDTLGKKGLIFKKKDPANAALDTVRTRAIKAYHNVRVYKSNMQAVADSLFYTSADSTLRWYGKPILWSQNSQQTGDTIYLRIKNNKLNTLQVIENAFLVNVNADSVKFNQVKGKLITAFFTNGEISNTFVDGNAESVFYNRDKDSVYTDMNQTVSSRIKILFKNKEITDLYTIKDPEGMRMPIKELKNDVLLTGFIWKPELRPRSKKEVILGRPKPKVAAVKATPAKSKTKAVLPKNLKELKNAAGAARGLLLDQLKQANITDSIPYVKTDSLIKPLLNKADSIIKKLQPVPVKKQ